MLTQPPFPPEDEYVFPTTVGQKRFWSLDALQPGNSAMNIPCAARLAGQVNLAALQQALDEILRRHEALRCRFETEGDELMQVVYPPRAVVVRRIDCTTVPFEQWPAKTEEVKQEEGALRFELNHGPFFRAALATFSPTEHVLMITMHHIANDGWSNGIAIREFAENYSRIVRGETPPFEDLPLQYADYAVWQKEWLAQPEGDAQKQYWTETLGDTIPVLNLPTDRPRSRKASTNGMINSLLLPPALSEGMRQMCQRESATVFMGYLAAYVMLLHRYTGRREFVIGSPAACRNQTELEGLIGLFANVILFRPRVDPTMTFRQLLHHVRDTTLASFARQEYPFELLGENLRAEDSHRGVPWLQAYFLFQKAFMQPQKMPGLELTPLRSISPGAILEWLLGLVERDEGVRLQLEYNTDLFDSSTIDRALRHLQLIISKAIVTLDFPIAELELDEPGSGASVVSAVPSHSTASSLLEAVVAAFASNDSATLLERNGRTLQLSELRTHSTKVRELTGKLSGPAPQTIAIASDDPLQIFASAIAVCQSGHTAVLTGVPTQAILRGTLDAPTLEATTHGGNGGATTTPALILRNDFATDNSASVTIEPGAILRQTGAVAAALAIQAQDRVLSTASAVSVVGWEEVLGSWLCGATVIAEPVPASGKATPGATVACLTSAKLSEIVHKKSAASLTALREVRLIVIDRDPFSPGALKALATISGPDRQLIQRFQAREIGATMAVQERPIIPATKSITPAAAVAGWTLTLVNRQGVRTPAGIPGLCRAEGGLAGAATSIVTGDWFRLRHKGSMKWLGHEEDLVRTADYTLELSELSAVACRHPAVWNACAVTTHQGDKTQVVLHIATASGARISAAELETYLGENLPAYVLPGAILLHEHLPVNADGRLDYPGMRETRWLTSAASTAAAADNAAQEPSGSAPRDEIETKLAALFGVLLRLSTVDVRRSFFDLGGHSLLAVKLFSRIEKEFQQRLPLATLLGSPSVRALATKLRQALSGETHWSCLVPMQTAGEGPKFFCVHGAGGNVLLYRDLARHMTPAVRFYGLQAQGLDGQSTCLTRIEDMAELYLHEILAEQPKGPYFIGGYCMGGNIAYEIARLLTSKGHVVGMVAMLDSYNLRKSLYRGTTTDRLKIWLEKGSFHLDTLINLSMAGRKTYLSEKIRMAGELIQGQWRSLWRDQRTQHAAKDTGEHVVAFVQNANHFALNAHNPKPLAATLVIFRPQKNYHTFPDPNQGWGELVKTPPESVVVTANPHAMLIEPFVQKLAQALSRRIIK